MVGAPCCDSLSHSFFNDKNGSITHLFFHPYRNTYIQFLFVWGVIMETHVKTNHVFLPQSKLHMEGFRSLKEGEAVEFTFKKSAKGLESIRVTGPGGVFCIGSERRPKGKNMQKRRSKGDRYGLEGSLCGLGGDMLRVRGTFPVLPLSWTRLPEIKRSLWPLATSGCRRCREGSA